MVNKVFVGFFTLVFLLTLAHMKIELEDTKRELAAAKLHVGEVLVREDSYQRDAARRLAKATVALENRDELLAKAALKIESLRIEIAGATAEAYDWQSSYRGQTASLESLKRDLEKVRCRKPAVKPVPVISCSNGVCTPKLLSDDASL